MLFLQRGSLKAELRQAYFSFAHSALASFSIGMSGSASFQKHAFASAVFRLDGVSPYEATCKGIGVCQNAIALTRDWISGGGTLRCDLPV
jgi:hypothetical protein